MNERRCIRCSGPLGEGRQRNARYCSAYCRSMAWHEARHVPKPKPTPVERFRSYLGEPTATGCIEWQGALYGARQYGAFTVDGRTLGAHRCAWFFANGEWPTAPLLRHSCDNPRCVNVEHLSEGDNLDNARDRTERQRSATGHFMHSAKLTDEQVAEIRGAYRFRKVTAKMLAARYGVSAQTVHRIVEGAVRTSPSRPSKVRPIAPGYVALTITIEDVS